MAPDIEPAMGEHKTTTTTTNNTKTTTPSSKKNSETTLTHLTKRFVRMLNANSERVINLNEASAKLSVAKRRIYDITNVLEGIGLLKKTSKNVTRWVDCPKDSSLAAPPSALNHHINSQNCKNPTNTSNTNNNPETIDSNLKPDAELLGLLSTYQQLDESVNDLEAKIRQQLTDHADVSYVTYQDIKSSFNDQIVIAVKAPPETRLEVNESLQIWMKSETGEIEVYLCPQMTTPTEDHRSYYDSGVSSDDHYHTDPTLSSALTPSRVSADDDMTAVSEDPFKQLELFEETHYNFMLDDNLTITSLFPDDNL